MAGEAMLGAQVAASIVTLAKAVNDFMKDRVSRGERAERLKAMNQEVKNLRDKIPLIISENEKLLGYEELHKETREFLNTVDNIGTFIRNAYNDKSRTLAHIEDLHDIIIKAAHPVSNSVVNILEQSYPFLKEDKNVIRHLYPIHDMLDRMHSLIELAWINKSTELDREVERYCAEIVEHLTDLVRYLENRIKKLSEKMKEELNAFENQLRVGGIEEE